jgi:hypothetical protein
MASTRPFPPLLPYPPFPPLLPYPPFPPYHTRQAFCLTIGASALHEKAF